MSNFIDEAVVEFISGNGGSGAVSFHREKHVPRGGPDGADGGRGGDVILIAERGKRTLYDFKLNPKFKADDGVHAVSNKRGRDGKSIEIKVPVGTVVTDTVLGEVLVDMIAHGMKYVICKGGRGGFGNLHYVSSVRQVPNFAQKGAPGDRVIAKLELKLLADVGLVGLPNAGKSTLLSRISRAQPKIGAYPFTTISPNLGVVVVGERSFVVADMPGLIEGASEGAGLGDRFLRHVERTKILVHVVDAFPIDESDPVANYRLIESELEAYGPELYERPRLIALNKLDVAPEGDYSEVIARFEEIGRPVFPISGVSGQGIEALLYELSERLAALEDDVPEAVLMPSKTLEADSEWDVERIEEGYRVTGKRILRMVAMTDMRNSDAVRYLHRRLERIGVIERLREEGAEEGDTVVVGDLMFNFTDEG